MKTKWKFLVPIAISSSFILASAGCNLREARSKDEYIKSFNSPNYIKSSIINQNSYVQNDNQALLSSPLIRWNYAGTPKYDKINHNFSKVTSKFLKLELAKAIEITTWEDQKFIYDKDDVELHNASSLSGIVQIINDESNNINSNHFFNNLKNAKKVKLILKDNINYVDKNGVEQERILQESDYANSYQYQENLADLNNLLLRYDLKKIDLSKPLEFISTAQNSKNLSLFLTKEITNNPLFNPLYDKEATSNNMLFVSKYVLNSFNLNQATYLKNNNSWDESFNNNSEYLSKVILKFNPVAIDEATYRLQMFNAFRQNLVSEAPFNLFNETQKQEIEEYSKIYGLTFTFTNASNENVNKYFYNLNFNSNQNYKFNNAFSKLVYGKELLELKGFDHNFYNKNSFSFLNLINNLQNQYIGNKILGYDTYWNSYISQLAYFDTPYNEKDKMYTLKDNINRIHLEYYTENDQYNYETIDFAKIGDKNGLIDSAYIGDKILDLNKQLKSSHFDLYKNNIKKILDTFYEQNPKFNQSKIEWTIPVFAEKTYNLTNYYDRLIKIINEVDSRINANYEFASSEAQNYIYKYQTFHTIDNSFASHLYSLIKLDSSLLINIWLCLNAFDNFIQKPQFYSLIEKISAALKSTLGSNYLQKISSLKDKNSSNLLDELLKEYNLDELTFSKKFINYINTNFSKSMQYDLLRATDDLLMIRQNETSYLFVNDYEKLLVQYFYVKPLNDEGITYYQDIKVY